MTTFTGKMNHRVPITEIPVDPSEYPTSNPDITAPTRCPYCLILCGSKQEADSHPLTPTCKYLRVQKIVESELLGLDSRS